MRRRLGVLVLSALLSLAFSSLGFADPPKRGRERTEARARKKRAKARKDRKGPKKEPREQKRQEEAEARPQAKPDSDAHAAQKAAQDAAQGADAQIVKEGDTSVKVMTFSGLDIEGRLKSPQLLYFVSRVHAEFERPKLPHRSFMPELMRTSEREPLR